MLAAICKHAFLDSPSVKLLVLIPKENIDWFPSPVLCHNRSTQAFLPHLSPVSELLVNYLLVLAKPRRNWSKAFRTQQGAPSKWLCTPNSTAAFSVV